MVYAQLFFFLTKYLRPTRNSGSMECHLPFTFGLWTCRLLDPALKDSDFVGWVLFLSWTAGLILSTEELRQILTSCPDSRHSESPPLASSHAYKISLVVFSRILDLTQMSLRPIPCEYECSHIHDNTWRYQLGRLFCLFVLFWELQHNFSVYKSESTHASATAVLSPISPSSLVSPLSPSPWTQKPSAQSLHTNHLGSSPVGWHGGLPVCASPSRWMSISFATCASLFAETGLWSPEVLSGLGT